MDDFFKYPRKRIGFMALITALEFFAWWLHIATNCMGREAPSGFFYFITPLTLLSAYCFISRPSAPKTSHKIIRAQSHRRNV